MRQTHSPHRRFLFPGGTIANNYLWKEGSFSLPENDRTKWAAEQLRLFCEIGRPYDMAGFARVCQRYGCEPIWVLNVDEESPDSVVELFDEFDRLKLGVKRIELGNESYWDGRSLMNTRKYMDYSRPLAQTIRKFRPGIEIGACFGSVSPDQKYNDNGNAKLAAKCFESSGMIIKLPDQVEVSQFVLLSPKNTDLRLCFEDSPDKNGNEVVFLFPEETIAKAGSITLSGFRLSSR